MVKPDGSSHLVHLRAVDVPDGLDLSCEESEGSCWDTSSSCSLDSHDNETNESSESLDDLGPRILGFRAHGDDDLLSVAEAIPAAIAADVVVRDRSFGLLMLDGRRGRKRMRSIWLSTGGYCSHANRRLTGCHAESDI